MNGSQQHEISYASRFLSRRPVTVPLLPARPPPVPLLPAPPPPVPLLSARPAPIAPAAALISMPIFPTTLPSSPGVSRTDFSRRVVVGRDAPAHSVRIALVADSADTKGGERFGISGQAPSPGFCDGNRRPPHGSAAGDKVVVVGGRTGHEERLPGVVRDKGEVRDGTAVSADSSPPPPRRARPPPSSDSPPPPPPRARPPSSDSPPPPPPTGALAGAVPPTLHAATIGSSRNFIGLLNEAFQKKKVEGTFGFEEVDRSGPPHKPVFTYTVTVSGVKHSGTATTKQEAKQKAAWAAMRTHRLLPGSSAACDRSTQPEDPPRALSKHPLCILNELFPGLQGFDVKVAPVAVGTETFFRATLRLHNTDFTGGVAKTKKEAKAAAAKQVLVKLFGTEYLNDDLEPGKTDEQHGLSLSSSPSSTHLEVPWLSPPPLSPHDVIARTVFEKFFEIIGPHPLFTKWKVLAGIAVTTPKDGCQVISLATGTKCVSGVQISLRGQSVNDCHAEVLVRRGFVRFLYQQLRLIAGGQPSSYIRKNGRGGYELCPNVEVHLVISTSPCGDGRIFAPFDRASVKTKGCLRVKVEAGMGTIPVRSFSSLQTWDAVMEGERLLTMSCSDKLCRRNVLGFQGSLLSQYLSPIYLKSVIVGSMCNIPHLQRALVDRLVRGFKCRQLTVPEPFQLHRPQIVPTLYQPPRQPGTKAPNHAVNWIIDEGVEIIDAFTGKVLHSKTPSRLCKQNFFQMWTKLYKDSSVSVSLFSMSEVDLSQTLNYREAKRRAFIYSVAKNLVLTALADGGCGQWVAKPREGSNFSADDIDNNNNNNNNVADRCGSTC